MKSKFNNSQKSLEEVKFLPDLSIESRVRLMVFSSGKVYKIDGDTIIKVNILTEHIYYEKTHSVYKHTYINFNFKKISYPKLMASLFIQNPNNYNKIQRKDNNINNNYASNFEWVKNNRLFPSTNKSDIAMLEYNKLNDYDQAAFQLIINNDESLLYKILFTGKMRKYICKSFRDRGVPSYKFEDFLDLGYEKLKERIIKYYYPRYDSSFMQFKKYCYLTIYFAAIANQSISSFIHLDVVPREITGENTIELEIANMFQILSGI